jgi:hypothetical protein
VGNSGTTGGTVNQSGGAVVLGGATTDKSYNLRVGHFPSEVSTYNLSGGTITFSQPPGSGSPSTSADPEVAGGTYVGIDGVGIFNQSGGTVTTNWVVLDNRGNSAAGTNMTTGIDQYNLTGGLLGSHYADIFAFVALILVLTLRPSGLLGERVADRA